MLLGLLLLACLALAAGVAAAAGWRRSGRLGGELAVATDRAEHEAEARRRLEDQLVALRGERDQALERVRVAERAACTAQEKAAEVSAAWQRAEARAGVGGDRLLLGLWRLEQARSAREWAEAAGPVARPLDPVSVTPAQVIETALASVRELVGTPSHWVPGWPPPEFDRAEPPGITVVLARLVEEAVRSLAKATEELRLEVPGPGRLLLVAQRTPGAELPSLEVLRAAAEAVGTQLVLEEDRSEVRVELLEAPVASGAPAEP
jgi:hypothetical protein